MRAPLVILTLVAALTTPGIAHAELAAGAKARLDAGLEHYNAGRYEAAIAEFEAAYAIDPDPQLLFAWAQAERLAKRCSAAVPRYRKYLESKPSTDAVTLATNGISLCEASAKPAPVEPCANERSVPWYKDPVGGAVVAGVVGIGVSIGFFVASSGNRDRADTAQTSAQFEAYLDRATTQRRIGVTFLVVGAGLVGGGIGYHFWSKRGDARGPVVGTTGSSLYVAGEF